MAHLAVIGAQHGAGGRLGHRRRIANLAAIEAILPVESILAFEAIRTLDTVWAVWTVLPVEWALILALKAVCTLDSVLALRTLFGALRTVAALITLAIVTPGTIVTEAIVAADLAVAVFVPPLLALRTLAVGPLALRLFGLRLERRGFAALVFEIDVIARSKLIAANDVGDRALRLHGAQGAEVVLGVLEMIFGQHPVAGSVRIAGELLVFFIDVLCRAAHLDPIGAIGIERAVGVVLWFAATAATTTPAVAVAVAIALHAFEISHRVPTYRANGPRLARDHELQGASALKPLRTRLVPVSD